MTSCPTGAHGSGFCHQDDFCLVYKTFGGALFCLFVFIVLAISLGFYIGSLANIEIKRGSCQ